MVISYSWTYTGHIISMVVWNICYFSNKPPTSVYIYIYIYHVSIKIQICPNWPTFRSVQDSGEGTVWATRCRSDEAEPFAVKRGWKIFQLNRVVYVCLMGKHGKIFELNGGFLSFPMLDVGYVHDSMSTTCFMCYLVTKNDQIKNGVANWKASPNGTQSQAGPSRPTLGPQWWCLEPPYNPKEKGQFQVCEVSNLSDTQQISNNYCNQSLTIINEEIWRLWTVN